ncbi:MAG: cytochrome c maturation protein CcmE [Deltaproteobacteria bacterium]|nr:MAG: cytochrome c maturation protein CcmE [Deltaproteobacteria bacterium]
MSKGVQIALGAGVCALLLGWYANTVLDEGATLTYYQTLEEFLAAPESAGSRPARVHGFVATGSIDRDVGAKVVRFRVQSQPPHAGVRPGGGLSVEYASLEVPDMFKDGAEVVIEGRLAHTGDARVFHATNLLAKCPSKFEAKLEDRASL